MTLVQSLSLNLAYLTVLLFGYNGGMDHVCPLTSLQEGEDKNKNKMALCTYLIMPLPLPHCPFLVYRDASNIGVGALLMQQMLQGETLNTLSKSGINTTKQWYTIIEKDALAFKWAIETFCYYLWGHQFEGVTDLDPLQWLHHMKDANPCLMRWYLALQSFVFTVCIDKSAIILMLILFLARPIWIRRPNWSRGGVWNPTGRPLFRLSGPCSFGPRLGTNCHGSGSTPTGWPWVALAAFCLIWGHAVCGEGERAQKILGWKATLILIK